MAKRFIDLVISLIGITLFSPISFLLAVLVKLDSPGTVFYRGVRAGRYGKTFRMFKFRTMVANADQVGGPSSAADDARITRTGRFLRKYKLDEFPQLINVLRGEMSLVGPRPEVMQEVLLYTPEEKHLLDVRPGITDWASIQFRHEGEILRGSSDPHQAYRERIRPQKIRLGLEYVRRHSLVVDCRILVQTLRALF
jgi:lipopolysaccharide/colanic/teichoic acid biosynthesis glycosyltransferase